MVSGRRPGTFRGADRTVLPLRHRVSSTFPEVCRTVAGEHDTAAAHFRMDPPAEPYFAHYAGRM
ncbi:hypothetical protein NONO_c56550 [Nocardia nova SH22a]|uniref:Uncharacterized protein n=1 Tax=Nocardia nova SH22a TaxID=1415166 RepID=W5TM75_9NOCA|nr:hypothetical protein NONO_c56550 [Nocardia nova SH22a]